MSPDYCAVEEIESMDLSKYRKITLQYADGGTVFFWSKYIEDASPDHIKEPVLVIRSIDILSKYQLLQIREQPHLQIGDVGAWHDIDD